jgi:hypothetical protein
MALPFVVGLIELVYGLLGSVICLLTDGFVCIARVLIIKAAVCDLFTVVKILMP